MELVYLWVEEYKNIEKQGFHFSPRFECKFYDEYETYTDENSEIQERLKDNCELVICDKKKNETLDKDTKACKPCKENDFIDNFFGDNINVTAIVGKNGSGKSSLLEMILTKVPKEKHKNYLLVGYSKYFYTHKFGNKDPNKLGWQEKFHSYGSVKDFKYVGIGKITRNDISLSSSSVEIGAKDNRDFNHNLVYLNGQELNFRLWDEFKYSDSDNNIFIPKYIVQYNRNLHILENKNFFYKFDTVRFYLKTLDKDEIINDINHIKELDTENKKNIQKIINKLRTENIFSYSFLLAFIRYSLLNLQNTSHHSQYIASMQNINNCSDVTQKEFEYIPEIEAIKNALDIIKQLDLKDEITNRDRETRYYYEMQINDKNIDFLWIFEYILDLSSLKEKNLPLFVLDLYDSSKKLTYAELSEGEKQYIRLLIEIISNKSSGDLSDIFEPEIYIFDEIETSLHPQWQKRIFNDIINIFKAWKSKNVHLIFLTHSPFLLSDIPKQNIIFLDTYKEEDEEVKNGKQKIGNCKVVDGLNDKKQTFGANIHTLLSDSFFMEDGLMGEFAKNKIRTIKVAHRYVLHKHKRKILFTQSCKRCRRLLIKRLPKFWQIQNIIGEPFLQKIVKNQLEEIELILLGKDEAIDKEIARLQALKEGR
jgi:predicted ATP-binding protein involved in virulence